jgi:hypothetical protein
MIQSSSILLKVLGSKPTNYKLFLKAIEPVHPGISRSEAPDTRSQIKKMNLYTILDTLTLKFVHVISLIDDLILGFGCTGN